MVEDDDDDRRIYHNLMVPHGDVIFEGQPDLVILDLNLPDCRGADAVKSIANKFPGQEVMVVTGNLDKHLSQTLMEIGAVDVLDKSTVTKGEFQNAIMAALREEACPAMTGELNAPEGREGRSGKSVSG